MKMNHSDKSYQAIVEAMQQIRYGTISEQSDEEDMQEMSDEEMEEAYMYEEGDEEEMAEMSDEEEEAVAQMMDEALYEMDMEDDEDNLSEADDGRKARRRRRLRQALLIGAGLVAAGGLGAAYGMGQDPGVGSLRNAERYAGRPIARALKRTQSGLGMMAGGVGDAAQMAVGGVRDLTLPGRFQGGRRRGGGKSGLTPRG